MPYKYKTLLLLSLIGLAITAQAKIYQWTDSNGQKHFGQTPPPKQAGKKSPKVEIRKEKFALVRSIRKTEHGSYCGKISLPQSDDPVVQLANVDYSQKGWLENIQRQQKQITKLVDQQLEFDTHSNKSGNNYPRIKRIEESIANYQCAHSWSKREKARLQNVRREFIEKLEQTREEYAYLKNRCGEKPDIKGWTNDEQAIAWAKCKSRSTSIKEHNQKLRELKSMERKANILSDISD